MVRGDPIWRSGDFGLRGFYPADAKGQYDMQLKAEWCLESVGINKGNMGNLWFHKK